MEIYWLHLRNTSIHKEVPTKHKVWIQNIPENRNCETPPHQTQTTAAFRGTTAHKFTPSHPNSQEWHKESCRSSANSQEFNSLQIYLLKPVPTPLCSLSCFSGWVRELQRKAAHELRPLSHNTILLPSQFRQPKGLWSCPCNYSLINNFIWNHHQDWFHLPSPLLQLPFSLGLGLVLTILLQSQLGVAFTTEITNEVSNCFISSKDSPLQRTKAPQLSWCLAKI